MSDDTSLGASQRGMIRMYSARHSAALISHILERFIPDACRREASDVLMDAFFNRGMELTSIEQRLEMEEIRRTMLEMTPKTDLSDIFTPPTLSPDKP